MKSMLNGEGIYGQLLENIWEECEKMSTLLKNILSNKKIHSEKNSTTSGILKTSYSWLQSKIQNKGSEEIFLGYSTRHGTNVYHMFNLSTQSINISHDSTWLNGKYGKWKSCVDNSHDSYKK